jgi:hypothetical protein
VQALLRSGQGNDLTAALIPLDLAAFTFVPINPGADIGGHFFALARGPGPKEFQFPMLGMVKIEKKYSVLRGALKHHNK